MKAQTYYDTQWKKIAENYSKGTYKSNLPLILEIQNRAIKEDNAIQLIKSLKAEFSIANLTNDDTKNDAASQFFKKLQSFDQKLKGENKLVYQVLLGDFLKIIMSKMIGKLTKEPILTLLLIQERFFSNRNLE
jgi:hypothetical protein